MHMVCHQAVRVNYATMLRCELAQVQHVYETITVLPEAVSSVVPPLNDMGSDIGNDETRRPRHKSQNGWPETTLTEFGL
jgi:hypothetical protein